MEGAAARPPTAARVGDVALEGRALSKSYGGIRAVHDLGLTVRGMVMGGVAS